MPNKDKTIFITIPAYNDPLLLRTIDLALTNALFPERLFFCIGIQYDDDKMPDLSQYDNNPNFNFIFYDVKERPGVYWIRREMSHKYSGQDYFLMIDSHMTFAKYWDASLINDYENLRMLHGDRTILTRASDVYLGNTFESNQVHAMWTWKVSWDNEIGNIERTIIPWVYDKQWDGDRFQKTPYACSHFFFTNGFYLSDVGFLDGIRSYTEELTITISSFLSGWDIYNMPEYVHIGHDSTPTAQALYGKDNFTIAEGKKYQSIFETPEEKLEIQKFVLLDNSKVFKVKNQRRNISEYYDLGDPDLKKAQEVFIELLGLDQN
jgi:hypothetical protein